MKSPGSERIFFLINPRSGGREATDTIRALREHSAVEGGRITVDELRSDAISAQLSEARTFDMIVIGGGDGTISTLVPYLEGWRSKIGILPLGTGNDLARELGLVGRVPKKNIPQLIEFYRRASTREVTRVNLDYGEDFASRTSFINYISFGFDAAVVAEFAALRETKIWRLLRGRLGNRVGYAAMGLRCLNSRLIADDEITLSRGGNSLRLNLAKSVIFTNIQSIMGLGKSNCSSSPFDERIECIVVNNVMNYLTMLSSYKAPLFRPYFAGSEESWEIRGLSEKAQVQIDGEPRPDIVSANYRISSGAKISMIVGPDYR